MSLRTPSSTPAASAGTSLRYKSLLRNRVIEVAWAGDDEPVTRRNPASADRIAADVPVTVADRAA